MHDAPADPDAPAGVQFTGLPRAAVPFLNCTVPLGVYPLGLTGLTDAVKVTGWPAQGVALSGWSAMDGGTQPVTMVVVTEA